jgi:hypothetical protein
MGKNLLVSLNLGSAIIGEAEPVYFEDRELEELRRATGKKPRYRFLRAVLFSPASEVPPESLPRLIRDLAGLLLPYYGLSRRSRGIVIELITMAADAIEEKDALCLWDSEAVSEIDYEKAVKRVEDFYPEQKKSREIK